MQASPEEVWLAAVIEATGGWGRVGAWESLGLPLRTLLEAKRPDWRVLRVVGAVRSGAGTLVLLLDSMIAVKWVPLDTLTPWDRGIESAVRVRPRSR